jgi:CubicO group peptidase (beta-lactamase class C family)
MDSVANSPGRRGSRQGFMPGATFRRQSLAWLGAFVLGLTLPAEAANDAVDDEIIELMSRRGIPGLSLAVLKDGAIAKARGYGLVEVGRAAPVTPDTLFQAAGVSQPVTALAALHLVEERRLTLDDDINRRLLNWELPSNRFTLDQKVTLRRLLSHSAGLALDSFPGYLPGSPLPTLEQVLNGRAPANTLAVRVEFVPGSKWQYSEGGFAIVQQLIYDVTGRPFADFMRETVLQPLGMSVSTFEQPLPAPRATQAATAHTNMRQPIRGRWHVYPEQAAAGLWTTPSDLARFMLGVQAAYRGRATPVISQAMAQQMLTRQLQDDGLGLFLSGKDATLRFDHGGRNAGFDTKLVAYADRGDGAAVMINVNDNSGVLTRVLEIVAEAYGWLEYPQTRPKPIPDTEPDVTATIRRIFTELPTGKIDRTLFTREQAFILFQQLATEVRAEMRGYGLVKAVIPVGRNQEGANRVYRYRIEFERETILVTCTYFNDGKIGSLTYRVE